MLKRMQTAQTVTFLQSLVIPFAFLIHTQRDAILDLVERVVVDGGRSGLDVLLNTWCENAETFQGFLPVPLFRGAASVPELRHLSVTTFRPKHWTPLLCAQLVSVDMKFTDILDNAEVASILAPMARMPTLERLSLRAYMRMLREAVPELAIRWRKPEPEEEVVAEEEDYSDGYSDRSTSTQ
ncbi:hypothetical protein FA95DRAFT_1612577 [Auriscalpium vulgare]|uniref:Uncharacterized protein n=2 Tax=Auriscalpium vulgare TaxID=40419 RepID=A0ACB8R2D6_9AGAM|nr:hypothetical protein FA95DRAFT_1613746 [Auriscalpium vulgare]KAI0039437.1 hypothetical protein FA95DRAFT_1612577 [Auriscalpium vulgare]